MRARTVSFDDYNSYDLGITFTTLDLGSPSAKVVSVDIPYRNGSLDLTDYFGSITYSNRTISMHFFVPNNTSDHMALWHDIQSKLNGKKMKIQFSSDDAMYYYGRLNVSNYAVSNDHWSFDITADCDPFQYEDRVLSLNLGALNNEDTSPYLYRQKVYSDADYCSPTLIGGTVAWNQRGNITSNTKTFTASSSYYYAVGNTYDLGLVAGHKYFLSANFSRTISSNNALSVCFGGYVTGHYIAVTVADGVANGAYSTVADATGITFTSQTNVYVSNANGNQGFESGDTVTIKNVMCCDLTQMFGSTIADYVYSLEQATSGSGIAWLQSYGFFTKEYYAYDAGSLQSVKTSARKVVGFNQWDEQWEIVSNRVTSLNYIPVIPDAEYCFVKPANLTGITILYYDADYNVVGMTNITSMGVRTYNFTPNSNAVWMKIQLPTNYGTTYNNDICINISDTAKNGTYEPYETWSYPLDSSLELRGIPKLDASNNLYYDGDTYASDGSVTRKYGIVDLGTLSWTYVEDTDFANGGYFLSQTISDSAQGNVNRICGRYEFSPVIGKTNNISKYGSTINKVMYSANPAKIVLLDSAYSDAATVKTAMSGVYLVYELATPTTESADSFTSPQIVGTTEEFVDERDVPVPVGNDTVYIESMETTLDGGLINELPEIINTVPVVLQQGSRSVYLTAGTHTTPSIQLSQMLKIIPTTMENGTLTFNWRYGRL